MTIPEIAIRRRVTTVMVVTACLFMGLISIVRLPQELYPSITFPQLTVVTNYLNAAPEEIESQITKPIEEAVGTVSGLRRIESISREGKSMVTMSFDWGINIDFAALGVREKIDLVKEKLPKEAEDPTVLKFDPLARPVMILSVSGPLTAVDLKLVSEKVLKDNLEKVLGVASAALSGGVDREILIEVDQGRLHAHHLSLLNIVDSLEKANLSYPAGSIKKGLYEYLIRTMGEFQSVKEIEYSVAGVEKDDDRKLKKDTFVERAKFGPRDTLEGLREESKKEMLKKRLILFREIGEIKDTFKEKTSISRYSAKENISISIQKQAGYNVIQVVDRVKEALRLLEDEIASRNVRLEIIYDQSVFIKQALADVRDAGLQGGLIVMVVLFLFLRNFQASFVVAIAIPITILGVFSCMFFTGISMNTMSLGGLSLGIGMLIDNGIAIVENIFRWRTNNPKMDPQEATIKAANEVVWPMFSSTLTTCAVFVPMIVFVPGVAGQLFKDLSWTVIYSQCLSYMASLSVTPLLACYMKIQLKQEGESEKGKLARWVKKFEVNLKAKSMLAQNLFLLRIIAVAFVLFLAGIWVMGKLEREVLPKVDQGQFIVKVNMPVGTMLEITNEMGTVVEDIILKTPDVMNTAVSVGSSKESGSDSGMDSLRSHQAQILVNLKKDRKRSSAAVLEDIRTQVEKIDMRGSEVQYILQESEFQSMGGGKPVVINIQGYDFEILHQYLDDVGKVLRAVPGVYGVQNDLAEASPETKVEIDRKKAALFGISVRDIALTVKAGIEGTVATKYKEGGREFDVRVCLRDEDKNNILRLGDLLITSPVFEAEIPLKEVAKIVKGLGPSEIKRQNRSRTVVVMANIREGVSKQEVLDNVAFQLKEKFKDIPEGYAIQTAGESLEVKEAFSKMMFALLLSILLTYMIMASQFESLVQPFIIMFTVPLCVIGAALGLWITHTSINAISLLGFILLGGVVVNNGIVLIEYINQMRGDGMDALSAAITASKIRSKPICMTAVSSLAGLIPMVMSMGGQNASIQAPMAVTTMGGLISSTALTIIVIPALYVLVDRVMDVIFRKFFYYDDIDDLEEEGEVSEEKKAPLSEAD